MAELDAQSRQDIHSFSQALTNRKWRKFCRKNRATFSATTTYLAQFMAHDMSMSALKSGQFDEENTPNQRPVAQNLRDSFLVLDTLYGQGMKHQPLLFENDISDSRASQAQFKLSRFKSADGSKTTFSPAFYRRYSAPGHNSRFTAILGDARNADTPILMSIATVFMRFHNLVTKTVQGETQAEKFAEARAKTIFVWHNIIRADILDVALHSVGQNQYVGLSSVRDVSARLAHGAFRCFHALVLSEYRFSKGNSHGLKEIRDHFAVAPLVEPNFDPTKVLENWQRVWSVDWADFHADKTQNHTCFSPSFERDFRPNKENTPIVALDILSGHNQNVELGEFGPGLRANIKNLFADLKGFNSRFSWPDSWLEKQTPLMIGFLAEAHALPKDQGTLGPVGSALVRFEIEKILAQARNVLEAQFGVATLNEWAAELPASFMELTDYQPADR